MSPEDRAQWETLIDAHLGLKGKPKPAANLPTLRFDVPELTQEILVKSVQSGVGPWRTLEAIHRESIEEKRAKKLSDLYDRTEIPEPLFEEREFGI
jgi:hypothetical protein